MSLLSRWSEPIWLTNKHCFYLNSIPLVLAHLSLLAIPFVEFSWWALVGTVVTIRILAIGLGVGFHRYFSHRSFETSRWFQFSLGVMGCMGLQNGPLWWATLHRRHHRHSDDPDDPHSPITEGFFQAHIGWLFSPIRRPDFNLIKDFTKYPELLWLDRMSMLPGILAAAVCFALGGWTGLVYSYFLATVIVMHVTFSVNSFGHMYGPQRFDTGESSRNNFILGFLATGDGWHNNHHRYPSSASHGMASYEFDANYRAIRFFKRLGIVWNVKFFPPALMALVEGNAPVPNAKVRGDAEREFADVGY